MRKQRSEGQPRRRRSSSSDAPYSIARAYLEAARQLSYADLEKNQGPPWASLPFGATGMALAMLRAPSRLRRVSDREWVAALLRTAALDRHRWGAFERSDLPFVAVERSFYYGLGALHLTRLQAGQAHKKPALVNLLASVAAARGAKPELLLGAAGHLTGLTIAWNATHDTSASTACDGLARLLLCEARGREGWARVKWLGLAHGRAGPFFALLGWSKLPGRELPAWFCGELERLADDTVADPTLGAPQGRTLHKSWCNGFAGMALLWSRAYECTSYARFLSCARQAASRIAEPDSEQYPGSLCCGLAGRSYGLLAVDRVDPAGDWVRHARSIALAAVEAMIANGGEWPNGLYRGFPGLVCLVADLARRPSLRLGFPLVEG